MPESSCQSKTQVMVIGTGALVSLVVHGPLVSIYSPGGHVVQWCGTVRAILINRLPKEPKEHFCQIVLKSVLSLAGEGV